MDGALSLAESAPANHRDGRPAELSRRLPLRGLSARESAADRQCRPSEAGGPYGRSRRRDVRGRSGSCRRPSGGDLRRLNAIRLRRARSRFGAGGFPDAHRPRQRCLRLRKPRPQLPSRRLDPQASGGCHPRRAATPDRQEEGRSPCRWPALPALLEVAFLSQGQAQGARRRKRTRDHHGLSRCSGLGAAKGFPSRECGRPGVQCPRSGSALDRGARRGPRLLRRLADHQRGGLRCPADP